MAGSPFDMMMMLMGNNNPQQMLKNAMMGNVKNNQTLTQLQNSIKSSGMSSKDYAMQFFKQRGMTEEQVMQLAQKFGAK